MSKLDVKRRPLAACVTQHAALMPFSHKSSNQLRRELCDEKMKNDMLTREVDETRRAMLELQRQMMSTCPPAPGHRSQRLVGRSCGRSRSLIAFWLRLYFAQLSAALHLNFINTVVSTMSTGPTEYRVNTILELLESSENSKMVREMLGHVKNSGKIQAEVR